jgi:hypothetical protein
VREPSPDVFREFEDLDVFYPGSKRRRRDVEPVKHTPVIEEERWDAHPYVKHLNGRDMEFFAAGSLAQALGRPLVTVRLWERKGYIPAAPFRLPKSVVHGREVLGRRLYTRALIQATVEAFERHGLMGKDRIPWSEHMDLPIELLETWGRIHASETA